MSAADKAAIDQIVTDVARRAGLTQSALQAHGVTKLPDPASRGYVAAAGAKELEAVGATITPGTDVSEWTVSWGQAGGGMYSTIPDLGTWAGTGLGIYDWGAGWIGHTGQIIGWESLVAYNIRTGAAFVAIVNETGSFMSALHVGLQVFPDLKGLLGQRRNSDSPAGTPQVKEGAERFGGPMRASTYPLRSVRRTASIVEKNGRTSA